MKTKNIPYQEVRNLLLQRYPVKLPNWKGYWKMSDNCETVEVHLKNGKIVNTPDIKYTFYDNWEIATVDNCEILKKEIEVKREVEKSKEKKIEIIDVGILRFMGIEMPIISIKENGVEKKMPMFEFEEYVGDEIKSRKLIVEFLLDRLPDDEVKDEIKGLVKDLNELEKIFNGLKRN